MWYQDCELQRGLWPLGHHVLLTVTASRKTQPLGLAFSQSPAVAGESGQWLTATQWHPRTILGRPRGADQWLRVPSLELTFQTSQAQNLGF